MDNKKNPLQVVQTHGQPTPRSEIQKKTEKEEEGGKTANSETSATPFELPDSYLLAREMREMFDEDIVTHVQGTSEPEAE